MIFDNTEDEPSDKLKIVKETVEDRPGLKRVTRRRFLRDATLAGFGAMVAAVLPSCVSSPKGSSPSPKDRVPSPTPGEPKPVPDGAPPPPTEEPECEGGILRVYLSTSRKFQFNQETFFKIASLYRQQGGIFPSEAELRFHEEESDVPGRTDAERNLIEISFRELYENHEKYVPEGYTIESLANGILAGELCNLMASESGQISGAEPPTKDNIEWVCESFGVMVAAIYVGRSYEQYYQDTFETFSCKGRPVLHFDPGTYQILQEVLQEPLLRFD